MPESSSTRGHTIGPSSRLPGPSIQSVRDTRRDARQAYKGYSFVFATDAYHDETRVFRRDGHASNAISYLKPLVLGHRIDSLPPLKLSFFVVAIAWTNRAGEHCVTSRVEMCQAWQVGFNALLYYGSFIEERGTHLSKEEMTWCEDQFSLCDDLFSEVQADVAIFIRPHTSLPELGEALGRIIACEQARYIPTLVDPPRPLSELSNPLNRTNAQTPLDSIPSTFLAATPEIARRCVVEPPSRHLRARELESRLRPWEPCQGHTIVDATTWTLERVNRVPGRRVESVVEIIDSEQQDGRQVDDC